MTTPKDFRPTILVVEDDPGTAMILRHILSREGFEVVHAPNGRDAVALVGSSEPPMLVLLDMMLPYVDGFEILRLIRGNLRWSEVPVIILTSTEREEEIVRALDAGATDWVQKPYRPEELLARIRRRLRTPS